MNTTVKNRLQGLDVLKALCAFCVITIHAPFPGTTGSYFTALCRIAVPTFFMITGYFYTNSQQNMKELSQIKKIFYLCLFSNVLYFLWGLFLAFAKGSTSAFFSRMFSCKSFLKFILLNESPVSGHLWYLNAMLYVLIIVYVLNKVLSKYAVKILRFATPCLLAADLIFGKYSLLILGREYPYIFVRNFICVGIPYFTIGCYLREHERQIASFRSKHVLIISLALLFALTTLAERYVLVTFHMNSTRDHYISTTLLSIVVFIICTGQFWNNKLKSLFIIGKKYSTFIYIIHPLIIRVLDAMVAHLSQNGIYAYIRPVAIYSLSILAGMVYFQVKNALKTQKW